MEPTTEPEPHTFLRVWCLIAIGTVAALCTIAGIVRFPRTGTKAETTKSLITRCEWIESRFPSNYGVQIANYLSKAVSNGASLEQAFSFTVNNPQRLPDELPVAHSSILTDAWGSPLIFMWRKEAVQRRASESLLSGPGPVLVWSAGPNRSNELGYGDDVIGAR